MNIGDIFFMLRGEGSQLQVDATKAGEAAGDKAATAFGSKLKKAAGGATSLVPIIAAGGEYVLSPEEVANIGYGDLDDGHKILDRFVKKMRKDTIRILQSLPGPKKD